MNRIEIDPRALAILERGERRVAAFHRGGMMNAMYDTDDLALQGCGVRYNTPFAYKGEIVCFVPGCFTRDMGVVAFEVDHNDGTRLATTDDALAIIDDDTSLRFHLDLGKANGGGMIMRMVDADNRAAMSIGCKIIDEAEKVIAGHKVRFISRARLEELSLVKAGAAGDAFAVLVNSTVTPKPVAGQYSATFNAAHLLHKVKAARPFAREPVQRSYVTADELNRWQTEETERLQEYARSMRR